MMINGNYGLNNLFHITVNFQANENLVLSFKLLFLELRVHFSSSHYDADEDSGFALVGLVLEDTLETTASVRQVSMVL
jgi:hypothetical protein